MGKEAKIGLAVIVGLFLVLGAVITMRVASLGGDSSPDPADESAETADVEPTSTQAAVLPSASGTAEAASTKPKTEPDEEPEPRSSEKPTILSPERPESSDDAEPKWRELASQDEFAAASDDPYAGTTPSYMPSPPRPEMEDAAGSYGSRYAAPPPEASGYASAQAGGTGGVPYDPQAGSRFDMPPAAGSTAYAGSNPSDAAVQQPESYSAPARDIAETRPSLGSDSGTGLRGDGTYEVQPNDNFWKISEKLYGTGAYFQALAEHNRKEVANQNQLQVGQLIAAPDVAELEQEYPAYCPKPEHRYVARHQTAALQVSRTGDETLYTVAEGDSLYRIARYELGDASRWYEIYQLNREVIGESYNHLRPGTQIILPDNSSSEPADAVTRRPETLY
ncbi:MAG: LysM peptidoglycan-binding domain-containing protein [Thermoguttaceae bacterium]